MRVEGLEALDKAAAGVQRGLKLVLDRRLVQASANHVALLKSHLKHGGKGEIRLVLALEDRGREIELVIPGRYDVSPARAGVLATVPGVEEVLEI
jgi:DNA polymerase-3 subunit alpha